MRHKPRILVVLPALNEEVTVALVVKEVHAAIPDCTILVVDDGSVDHTGAELARPGPRSSPIRSRSESVGQCGSASE